MTQIWWEDEILVDPALWAARTWRAGIDWQKSVEISELFCLAKRAVQEYRDQDLGYPGMIWTELQAFKARTDIGSCGMNHEWTI